MVNTRILSHCDILVQAVSNVEGFRFPHAKVIQDLLQKVGIWLQLAGRSMAMLRISALIKAGAKLATSAFVEAFRHFVIWWRVNAVDYSVQPKPL